MTTPRRPYPRPFTQAEPFQADTRRTVIEVVAGVVVLHLWGVALIAWLLIAQAVPS